MQKYLINTAHMNDRTANVVMTAVLFTYMIMQTDIWNFFPIGSAARRRCCYFGGLATLCTVPLMYAIADVKRPAGGVRLHYCGARHCIVLHVD